MTVSLRPVDDCIITVPDVDVVSIFETPEKFLDCKLLSVSILKKNSETSFYFDICDVEVF